MKGFILFLFALSIYSCQDNSTAHHKVMELEHELKGAQEELLVLTRDESDYITHIVLFETRDDLSEEEKQNLLAEISRLEDIEEVKNLNFGFFTDLSDQRALSQYEFSMSLDFEDAAAYDRYQSHHIHINVKKDIGDYLSGPPVTYDFK